MISGRITICLRSSIQMSHRVKINKKAPRNEGAYFFAGISLTTRYKKIKLITQFNKNEFATGVFNALMMAKKTVVNVSE